MTDDLDHPAGRPGAPPVPSDETGRHLADLHENIDFLIHEIRTPLTAIISSAEILMGQLLSPQERDGVLDIIHKEALRINELLGNFHQLHQQQAESWLEKMTFSAVRIADLLQDAATRFRNASPRHVIRVNLATNLPPVRGDRMKLDLVVRNLLANAIKYSPDGGTILLSAWEARNEVVVIVQDHGIGISEENLPKIFDRNFRINHPDSHKTPGSGQGLAIVSRIIKNHGGTLRVESEVGKGSAFFFTLPILD
jgi:signal transduction histidine kinase